nr:hypothetical protein B0A51_15504 [Rachicladosporium sp. CCFEE 5018]
MPKENRKRGRRMDGKKRKLSDAEEAPSLEESSKRHKSEDGDSHIAHEAVPEHEDALAGAYPGEKPFFGMLDDDEQEYFKNADQMLELNQFEDAESRQLFLENVWREADGKELKIANSQSCSRLMERLIQLSTPTQLESLFGKIMEHFVHLMTHRFASHCCEALFLNAAPAVAAEVLSGGRTEAESEVNGANGSTSSIEDCFLSTATALQGNIGFLMTERYASHPLRILLLVLAGESLDSASTKQLLQSKKKESVKVEGGEKGGEKANDGPVQASRTVPKSFSAALESLISESVAGLDTDRLRGLATHANGNPTLQLLLRVELSHFGKQRAKDENSIIRTLLPDDPITAECGSASFINGLMYDPVGSRLAETLVQCAPAKLFKNLYTTLWKERLPSYARNEIASFVACKIIERLGKDDLLDVHEVLAPHIPSLLERDRTNVVRTLIQRCTIRDIDTKAIAVQINSTWDTPDGFEIRKLLKIGPQASKKDDSPHDSAQSGASVTGPLPHQVKTTEPVKAHFNILAQVMILVPGALSGLILDSLVLLDAETLLDMCRDPIVSRTLQAAITSKTATIITTRKLVQHFYGHIGDMAVDKAASHVVDCIWEGTHGLAFIRERIAEELAENEAQLRESPCGRAVWKNWKMDLYKRRRLDWIRQSKNKASNDGFQSFEEIEGGVDAVAAAKTPLQMARERHVKNKAAKEKKAVKDAKKASVGVSGEGGGAAAASGVNATPVNGS